MHTSLATPSRSSLCLLLLAALCALSCACNSPEPVDDTTLDTSLPIVPFDNALSVSDQRPDPPVAITIDSVTLDEETPDALIIIRDADASGLPAATIGHLVVDASANDLSVPLDRPVIAGERLHAFLYEPTFDTDGDEPVFLLDRPLLGTDGLPVHQPFQISPAEVARLQVAPEQSSPGLAYIESLQVEQVEATTQNSLIAVYGPPDPLASELPSRPLVALLPLRNFGAQDLSIPLAPGNPGTSLRFANGTSFEVALYQDNAPLGSLGPEDVLELDADGEPVSASTLATLDPPPASSLTCTLSRITCGEEGPTTLAVQLDVEADHDGFLLARYTDTEGAPRSALFPIPAGPSSLDSLTLPSSIACDTEIDLLLLVDLPDLSQEQLLTLDPLPLARDAENNPQLCALTARDPAQLISNLSLVDEDTLSLEVFASYLAMNPSEALFLAISSTGDTPTLLATRRLTESLSQIEIDLVSPVSSGDTLLFKLFLDGGEPFIFEPENGVDAPLFLDEQNTQPAEQTLTIP